LFERRARETARQRRAAVDVDHGRIVWNCGHECVDGS
jgi:hypothetical protein